MIAKLLILWGRRFDKGNFGNRDFKSIYFELQNVGGGGGGQDQ